MDVHQFLHSLEQFAAQRGAPVFRDSLAAFVCGRVEEHRIVLRHNMSAEQQLFTLIHELTHLIAHRDVRPRVDRTVCEYEAEAVERMVAAELGVIPPAGDAGDSSGTDDLLACSVVRVQWAARTLVSAAHGGYANAGH